MLIKFGGAVDFGKKENLTKCDFSREQNCEKNIFSKVFSTLIPTLVYFKFVF